MIDRTWHGYWWAADAPSVRIPGTLHCSEQGEVRLELIGGFDIEIRQQLSKGMYSISADKRPVPLIHGECGKETFTLLDNICTHASGSGFFSGPVTAQHWEPHRTLRGICLESATSPIFVRAHLRLERLLHWSSQSSLRVSVKSDEEGGVRRVQPEMTQVEPVTAQWEDVTVTLSLLSRDFETEEEYISNERSISAKEAAVLTFTPADPVHCAYFDRIQSDLQDLLTLATYEPCGTLSNTLVCVTETGRFNEVEVIGRQVYQAMSAPRRSRRRHPLFTLSDIPFSEVIPRWLKLKDAARTACNILFGLRYIEHGYTESRLLAVATAAESLHRSLRKASTPLTKADYRELKKKILLALSEESDHLVEFVKRGLHNYPTYNDRMLELASIPDKKAVDSLLGDHEEWAASLKRSRNDFAHANDRSGRSDETSDVFVLMEVTYALLCLVLMSEIGISEEVQRQAVEQNPRIRHFSRKFKSKASL